MSGRGSSFAEEEVLVGLLRLAYITSFILESWADVGSFVLLVQPKKDGNKLSKISKKIAAGIAEQKWW